MLMLLVVALGVLAATHAVTSVEMRADMALQSLGWPGATSASIGLTAAAQEAVGLIVLGVALVLLVLQGRRFDAVRLLAMGGAAWATAFTIKHIVDRPRPPATLWLLPPDPTGSFPSGHATTAAVIVLITAALVQHASLAIRVAAVSLAACYAICIGLARVYLGDHYPTDILASYLTVIATTMLVAAITNSPQSQRLVARIPWTSNKAPSPSPEPGIEPDSEQWHVSRRVER
jgi:membrane-associated phospholipid phosphatase